MNASAPSFDHIYNAIGRDFTDEFPELTIVFVLYAPETTEKTLEAKRSNIVHHPAGKDALAQATKFLKSNANHGGFCAGFATHIEPKFMGLLKKREDLAICMVETKTSEIFEDHLFACRHAAYAAGYEALHKHIVDKRGKKDERTEKEQADPAKARANRLRLQLMADCFATMMMENTGTKGVIQTTIKKYCALTMEKTIHFWPEDHPLPMALDGLNVVYKDLKDQAAPKAGPFAHTHFMAEEIGNTYDDISLMQWVRFANNAQEMAWAGYNTNEILSAAIYSADNPYIRSNAHICAESLNTNPVPLKNVDIFNPFAGEETVERNHLRICRTKFMNLLENINENNNPELFFERARQQCDKFISGNPLGWCAPALIEAENAYRLFQETPNAEENMIANAFQAVCSHLKWRDLHRLNRKIIYARRTEKTITDDTVVALMENEEVYITYRGAFEILFAQEKSPPR